MYKINSNYDILQSNNPNKETLEKIINQKLRNGNRSTYFFSIARLWVLITNLKSCQCECLNE